MNPQSWCSELQLALKARFGIDPMPHDIYPGASKYSLKPYFATIMSQAGASARPEEALYQAWQQQLSEEQRGAFSQQEFMMFYGGSPPAVAELLFSPVIEQYQRAAWEHGITLCASVTGSVAELGAPIRPEDFDYYLIVIPAWVPLLVIEKLHGHFGDDEPIPHGKDEFIAFMRSIDQATPFMITRADRFLRLRFIEPVPDPEGLIRRLSDYNSDLIDQSDGFEEVVAELRDAQRVSMWWD